MSAADGGHPLRMRAATGSLALALIAVLLGLAGAGSLAPAIAAASAPFCAPDQAPSFGPGFQALRDQVGDPMGEPVECEHADAATGDTQQQTTTGLAFYRKATNTVVFSAGDTHWALLSGSLVRWVGAEADPPDGLGWAQRIRAAPSDCSLDGFPRTLYLPPRTDPTFADLPLGLATAEGVGLAPVCGQGPPVFRLALGDPNLTDTALFAGQTGPEQFEFSQSDPYGRCPIVPGGFCTTTDPLNWDEWYYLTIRDLPAVVRRNTHRPGSPDAGSDFWEIAWYDPAENMSYSVDLWGSVARRVGATGGLDVLAHRPLAERLAQQVSTFVAVRMD